MIVAIGGFWLFVVKDKWEGNIFYYIILWLAVVLLIIAFTIGVLAWFTKSSKSQKWKKMKYFLLWSSIFALAVVFFPMTCLGWMSGKIKCKHIWLHLDKYLISLFVALIIATIVGLHLYFIPWPPQVKYNTIVIFISFFVWRLTSSALLYVYHKRKKHGLNDEEYVSIKREVCFLVFAFITVVTVLANCMSKDFAYGALLEAFDDALVIYVALEALLVKWEELE